MQMSYLKIQQVTCGNNHFNEIKVIEICFYLFFQHKTFIYYLNDNYLLISDYSKLFCI